MECDCIFAPWEFHYLHRIPSGKTAAFSWAGEEFPESLGLGLTAYKDTSQLCVPLTHSVVLLQVRFSLRYPMLLFSTNVVAVVN